MNWKINLSSLKPFGVRYIFWLADVTLVLKVSTHSTIKNNMKKCNLVIFGVYCCFGLQFWICVKKNSTHHYCTDIFLMPNFSQRHELWLHMVTAWISCKYVDNSTKMAILILSTNDKFQFLEFGLFTFNIFRPWLSRMVNFENNKQNLIYACYGK